MAFLSELQEEIVAKLHAIHEQNIQTHRNQEKIMATLTGLETAISEVEADAQNIIAELQKQKEGQITQEALDAQTARIQAIGTTLKDATAPSV